MIYPVVTSLAERGLPVRLACRTLGVSAAGYYDSRRRPPSARATADAQLTVTIGEIHAASRGTYGAPRVHAELRLGFGLRCGRKRVERLMTVAGLAGVHRRRLRRHQPAPACRDDLVQRRFVADAPDRLWVTDITQHRTGEGWVYAAVVLDVFSRRVVGWSIADHLRTELVVDALDMARWRRNPTPASTVVHSDRGSQGGFKRSSQHLIWRCWDGTSAGLGQAADGQGADAVARASAGLVAGAASPVLGADRGRTVERTSR